MTEKINLPETLLAHAPWKEDVDPIWPVSLFILHRNIPRFFFPPKLNEGKAELVFNQLKGALLSTSLIEQPQLLRASDLSPIDKECLYEHYLCLESFQNTTQGQGFVIDGPGRLLAFLNIEDHLQIHFLDTKGEWENAFARLSKIDTALGEQLGFAFSPKFGFLTADPTLCGTGFIALIYLHLPALIHTGQLDEILIKHRVETVVATSMEGAVEKMVGDLLLLKNAFTVGVSEEQILRTLHESAIRLSALEKSAREKLKAEPSPSVKDEVSRAYGLLLHSYQLQTREALNALSLLKLGV
ncbi:MAG: hypothetical protein ACHQT8_08145, partial [Chlamydiales bacterium]